MPPARDLEKELEKLRRVESNKQCPNCWAEEKLGFRNCCVKFSSFVCGNCKAAHQVRLAAARVAPGSGRWVGGQRTLL